jgi:hypothetical protein
LESISSQYRIYKKAIFSSCPLTVRGHGRFENLGRLLRLPGFRKIFGPNASDYIKS